MKQLILCLILFVSAHAETTSLTVYLDVYAGQTVLGWTANPASAQVTHYTVYRSTTSGGPYTTVASPTATTYTDNVPSVGKVYYYVVTASNADGESAYSNEATASFK